MSTGNRRAATRTASLRAQFHFRRAFAFINTISFIAMIWRFWFTAYLSSNDVPFQWMMLTYLLGGCVVPLTLIGTVALINALFWNQGSSDG